MSFFSDIIKWFHDAIMGFEARISRLEQHNSVEPAAPTTPPPPAQVAEHVSAATPKPPEIDYAKFDSVAALQIRIGRGLSDAEINAWMAAHPDKPDPRTHSETGASTQTSGPAHDFSGSVLDWDKDNGSYRKQPGKAGVATVFAFTAPRDAHVILNVPFGPFTGSAATRIAAQLDDGPVEDLLVNTVAAVAYNGMVSAGSHVLKLTPNGDVPELRVQWTHD